MPAHSHDERQESAGGVKRERPSGTALQLTSAERAELGKIAAKRQELEENLRALEKQLGDLETTYLDATTAESTPAGSHRVNGYGGNLMRGWDALVTSSGPAVKAAQALRVGKHRYGAYERIFSLSSVTSPASIAMRQQQQQHMGASHHASYHAGSAVDAAAGVFYSSLFARIVNSKRENMLLGTADPTLDAGSSGTLIASGATNTRASEKVRTRRSCLLSQSLPPLHAPPSPQTAAAATPPSPAAATTTATATRSTHEEQEQEKE